MSDTVESVDDAKFMEALQQNSLNFGFENGRVKDVCSTSEDQLWVTNLKKGILSAFQQSVSSLEVSENVTETDVVGRCETQYTAMGTAWGKSTLKKVKDMYSCTGNQALYQYALNLPDFNIQHLPLLSYVLHYHSHS